MDKNQRIINILCAIAFVVGFVFTVADGWKEFLGLSQGIQYLANFFFICLVLPVCIGCSSFPQWVCPDLFTEETDKSEEEPCRQ